MGGPRRNRRWGAGGGPWPGQRRLAIGRDQWAARAPRAGPVRAPAPPPAPARPVPPPRGPPELLKWVGSPGSQTFGSGPPHCSGARCARAPRRPYNPRQCPETVWSSQPAPRILLTAGVGATSFPTKVTPRKEGTSVPSSLPSFWRLTASSHSFPLTPPPGAGSSLSPFSTPGPRTSPAARKLPPGCVELSGLRALRTFHTGRTSGSAPGPPQAAAPSALGVCKGHGDNDS